MSGTDPRVDPAVDSLTAEVTATQAAELVHAMAATSATVAIAESLTGGLLCAALTDAAGSSAVVRGAVVAYATDLKSAMLDVPDALLRDRGPVDSEVAVAMARGVRSRLEATYGVACTGVAGPASQGGHPPGTVHIAVVSDQGAWAESLTIPGGRAQVRAATVAAALDLLARVHAQNGHKHMGQNTPETTF
jgi:nicotinamide-nucleotide amidase